MKSIKLIKPGTTKTQLVEPDKVNFYRQFGWEPEEQDITAVLKPRKKTAQPKPAVEGTTPSEEEVGDDNKGD